MAVRIAIPVENEGGLDARLAEHFGRAPYFVLVNLDEEGKIADVKTVSNSGEHFGGKGHAHDAILKEKPNVIIVPGMGPRGLSSFQEAGIAVLRANTNKVRDLIFAYQENKLQELIEGCHQAHEHQGKTARAENKS